MVMDVGRAAIVAANRMKGFRGSGTGFGSGGNCTDLDGLVCSVLLGGGPMQNATSEYLHSSGVDPTSAVPTMATI
jgi:hypothetical protein